MKDKLVVFEKLNAVIYKGHFEGQALPENSLLNPDFSNVKGVPLQYWKLVDNKILAMDQGERDERDLELYKSGKIINGSGPGSFLDNKIQSLSEKVLSNDDLIDNLMEEVKSISSVKDTIADLGFKISNVNFIFEKRVDRISLELFKLKIALGVIVAVVLYLIVRK